MTEKEATKDKLSDPKHDKREEPRTVELEDADLGEVAGGHHHEEETDRGIIRDYKPSPPPWPPIP
jgi:hypothetical protein